MATVQNPFRAAPGTVIRPDGNPAGRGGRVVIWLALGVVAAVLFTLGWEAAEREQAARGTETVEYEGPRPGQAPPVAEPPLPEPVEPITDPLLDYPDEVPPPPPPDEPEELHSLADEPAARCLDEVGCLLAEDPPDCCKLYAGGRSPPEPLDDLDVDDIKQGVKQVRKKIDACAAKSLDVNGIVRVRVTVSKAGKVTKVEIVESPKAALGACVAKAIGKARFPKSEGGALFTYPFSF